MSTRKEIRGNRTRTTLVRKNRHFMELLEGEEMEGRQRNMNEKVRDPMEEELKVEEFRRAIKRLKVKAAEVDRIPMEICEQGARRRDDRLNKNNKKRYLAIEKKSIVVPLYKRRKKNG